jgi:hypothetical protein
MQRRLDAVPHIYIQNCSALLHNSRAIAPQALFAFANKHAQPFPAHVAREWKILKSARSAAVVQPFSRALYYYQCIDYYQYR